MHSEKRRAASFNEAGVGPKRLKVKTKGILRDIAARGIYGSYQGQGFKTDLRRDACLFACMPPLSLA